MTEAPRDLTDAAFWDSNWEKRGLPEPINPHSARSRYLFYTLIHRKLRLLFAGLDPARTRLIEVGCGSSAWLPYFAKEMGFQVSGLDYSEIGCRQTRAVLDHEGVKGDVYQADMFNPPAELQGAFDVVFSFGVVEHFQPPERCVQALTKLLRPGGIVVTVVPNLLGALGAMQSWVDRSVYDVHVLHTDKTLADAHRLSGLDVLESDYFFSVNFGWVIEAHAPPSLTRWPKLRVLSALRWGSRLSWWLEQQLAPLPPGRLLSPAILCAARKPHAQPG